MNIYNSKLNTGIKFQETAKNMVGNKQGMAFPVSSDIESKEKIVIVSSIPTFTDKDETVKSNANVARKPEQD